MRRSGTNPTTSKRRSLPSHGAWATICEALTPATRKRASRLGGFELVLEEGRRSSADAVVDRLGAVVVRGGEPGDRRRTVAPRDLGGCLDERVRVSSTPGRFSDEEVLENDDPC